VRVAVANWSVDVPMGVWLAARRSCLVRVIVMDIVAMTMIVR
jgi:hypothetical protein